MITVYSLGDKVKAAKLITESKFNGQEVWTHAEVGDVGEVIHTGDKLHLPTVRFEKTGTATIVAPTEIEAVSGPS